MKRIFTFGLMLTAVFALTNCTEELVDPTISKDEVTQETVTPEEEGIPFQVYASFEAETKTAGEITTDGKLKTKWVSNDKIHVFYEDKEGTLVNAGVFTVSDTDNGIFNGFIPSNINPEETYNWYFVYDATKDNLTTTSNEGVVTATVTIGSSEQTQSSANNNTHIGGASNCPMWGKAENVSGSVTPRVQMSHLASLYEVTISNQTEDNTSLGINKGSINVNSVGMSVSSTGTWLTKYNNTDYTAKQKALVGDFTLDILNGKLSQVSTNKNYSINLNLTTSTVLDDDNPSAKYYFVTAPVDIQSGRTTDPNYYALASNPSILKTAAEYNKLSDEDKELYEAATLRQDVLDFYVNGVYRSVAAQAAYNQDTKSGKLYKFTIPIHEMTHPLVSDIIGMKANKIMTSNIPDILTVPTQTPLPTATVNGHSGVNFYTIADGQSIVIDGTATDLLYALDIGFFATSWNNLRAAMTISRVNFWFPTFDKNGAFNGHSQFAGSDELETGMIAVLKNTFSLGSIAAWGVWKLFGWLFTSDMTNGVLRDEGLISLSQVIDPQTLTFNGLIENGCEAGAQNKHITVLSEAVAHKGITAETINNLLSSKFTYEDEEGEIGDKGAMIVPTYAGLLDVINGEADEITSKGHRSAFAVYKGLLNALDGRTFDFGDYSINLKLFVEAMIPNVATFKQMLPYMRFQIEIIPYPYAEIKSAYGSKGNPIKPDLPTNPIVIWGLDALGPNVSPNVN